METKIRVNIWQTAFYIIFGIFLISACNDEQADNENTDENEKFTKQEYTIPQNETVYYDNLGNRLHDTFYFVGWSKDGKAAYILEPADEATGYYFFNFVIFDTQNNKTVYEWTIDETDAMYEGDLARVWENNKNTFTEEMTSYEIYPEKEKINNFPLMYEKANYSLEHKIDYVQHEFFPMEVVNHAEIFLNHQNNKSSIFNQNYDADLLLNVKATGCIISPFGNNALLTVAEEQRGYEGPPHLIRFRPVGFSFPEN